jgi:hypothetical protein
MNPINPSVRAVEQHLRRLALSPKARPLGRLRAIDRLARSWGFYASKFTGDSDAPLGVRATGRRYLFLRKALVGLRSAPLARDLIKMYVDERLLALRTGVPNDPSIVWVEERTPTSNTGNIAAKEPLPAPQPAPIDFERIASEVLAQFQEGDLNGTDMDNVP